MKVEKREFIEKVTPLLCMPKNYREMQATQTYTLLRDIGFLILNTTKLKNTLISLKNDYFEYNKEIQKQGIPMGTDECGLRIARASKFVLIQFIEKLLEE